jgi:hypothetical protein
LEYTRRSLSFFPIFVSLSFIFHAYFYVYRMGLGPEGKLDTIAEGGMPGDRAGVWCIFGHDGPPYVYSGVAVHGTWVFGEKSEKFGARHCAAPRKLVKGGHRRNLSA